MSDNEDGAAQIYCRACDWLGDRDELVGDNDNECPDCGSTDIDDV